MNEQDYLAHHGVKGQRWGVRRRDYVPVGRSGGSGRPRHGAGVTRPNVGSSGSKKGVVKKAATAAAIIGALGGIGYLAATGRYSDVISYGKQAYNKISKFYKGVKVSAMAKRMTGDMYKLPSKNGSFLSYYARNRMLGTNYSLGTDSAMSRGSKYRATNWGVGTFGRLKPGNSNYRATSLSVGRFGRLNPGTSNYRGATNWGVGTSGRLNPGTSNALDYARRMNRYYQR